MNKPAAPGLGLALGAAAAYGLNAVFARQAADVGIAGATLVFYRMVLLLAIVVIGAWMSGHALRVPRGERRTMVVLGLSSAAIGTCYLSAVAFIPVTVAVVIFYLYPSLIVLLSPLVERRRLDWPLVGGAALAFAGVILVVGPAVGDLDPRGIVLALMASVATAIQFFAAARATGTGVAAKVFWINLLALPITAGIAIAAGVMTSPVSFAVAPWPTALTILGFVLGFFMQMAALARISAVAAGLAFCLEPVVAALASTVLLGERLGGIQILGGVLVLTAIAGSVILADRRPAPPVPVQTASDSPS